MQIVSLSGVRSLVLFMLVGNCILTDALSLRQRSAMQSTASTGLMSGRVEMNTDEDVKYKVLEKKSIKRDGTLDCLCEMGHFWHWRIKACIEQGSWGYECGFFPGEHHDKVCNDGLKCNLLNGTQVTYGGYKGAVPANCQKCSEKDKCLTGEDRHSKSCLKEYKLSGSACQTVRVTVTATAEAKVTEEVTKTSVASATATATAKEKATASKDDEKASATKEATAEGEATAKVEASGKATALANATKEGTAEGKACVTVDEVKEIMELKDVPRMPAVLSAQVVSKGDEIAFDRAYAKALEAARMKGLLKAGDAAAARARAEAREHAGLEAKAKAEEAAAWKAEAGAEKDAQEKAKAEALAKAQKAAAEEAAAAAKAAEEAAAAAKEGRGSQSAADAAAKAAAEAKAKQEALADYLNGPDPTDPPRPTTPTTTNAPRKIPAEDVAAQYP